MTTTPSSSGKLLITKDGQVTTVTLNRPEVHNALDKELSKELNLAMKEIDTDRQSGVAIIVGAGGRSVPMTTSRALQPLSQTMCSGSSECVGRRPTSSTTSCP